jgi:hypothetical protein
MERVGTDGTFPSHARPWARPDDARLASRRIPSAIQHAELGLVAYRLRGAMCLAAAICSGAKRREIGDLAWA